MAQRKGWQSCLMPCIGNSHYPSLVFIFLIHRGGDGGGCHGCWCVLRERNMSVLHAHDMAGRWVSKWKNWVWQVERSLSKWKWWKPIIIMIHYQFFGGDWCDKNTSKLDIRSFFMPNRFLSDIEILQKILTRKKLYFYIHGPVVHL